MTEACLNYFTEVEEHFRLARGTPLFRLSSQDWMMIEGWKKTGVPIEAVLRGIDEVFASWCNRSAQAKTQMINSLTYCAPAIVAEARRMAESTPTAGQQTAPFSIDDVRGFVARNAAAFRMAGDEGAAVSLESLDLDALYSDLEQLEQRLTAIEQKTFARLQAAATDESLLEVRRLLDLELKPYRGRMSPDQLAILEKQLLEKRLLEAAGLPRLSLFYL